MFNCGNKSGGENGDNWCGLGDKDEESGGANN